MLRVHDDVEFEELGTTDELESLNRNGSNTILNVSKVRAHLREHHDLPSTTTSLWPSVTSPVSSSDAARQHPPLFLVKLPPRCPSECLSTSKTGLLPSHDPFSRSSLSSPRRKKKAPRSNLLSQLSTQFSSHTKLSSSTSSSGKFSRLESESTSFASSSGNFKAKSSKACQRTPVSSQSSPTSNVSAQSHSSDRESPIASRLDTKADFSSDLPISLKSPAGSETSSSSSLPSPRTTSPSTHPLPRAHSADDLHSGRVRSLSCEISSTVASSSTLTQRRPRSCHTSPQMALTLMDEYFLERIETHVSLLEKMRVRCCADGHAKGPVVAVTNWQHAEDYPPAWISKLKNLISDPRFPAPMYLETDTEADDDEVEGVLMSLIRNKDVCDEVQERRRVKSLSVYAPSKSPYHLCSNRIGSLIAILLLLVLIVSISRWYMHARAGVHDRTHDGGGDSVHGGGHGAFNDGR